MASRGSAAIAPLIASKRDTKWAVYVGTLGESYDIPAILRAAEGADLGCRIVVAGAGPLAEQVRRASERLGQEKLTFLGPLDHDDVLRLCAAGDIGLCLYGSSSTVEMPDKFYDYSVTGLPIVHSLGGELREICDSEKVGLYYRPGQPDDLSAQLCRLSKMEAVRHEMSVRMARLADRFDRGTQFGKYVKLIEEVVAIRAARRI